MSYKYLTKKEIKLIRSEISSLIAKLVSDLKKRDKISTQFILIGSGARNMITYNNDENIIDFDYNLKIFKWQNKVPLSLNTKEKGLLKKIITENMNDIFKTFKINGVHDSTSAITTKPFKFKDKKISVDLAIICENDKGIYHLSHKKTGNTHHDEYKFELIRDVDKQYKKQINELKRGHKWNKVRDEYLKLKDKYKNDDIASISIYIQAIANVYNWN